MIVLYITNPLFFSLYELKSYYSFFIYLLCDRDCPSELQEAIASIIYAAPRCSDLPELMQVRNLFSAKYGKEFAAAAAELRPDSNVNRMVYSEIENYKKWNSIAKDMNLLC